MIDVVKVFGELHIVSIHGLKHVVTVARDRKLDPLKDMSLQGKDILQIIDIVEWDSVVAHERFCAAYSADEPQQRE